MKKNLFISRCLKIFMLRIIPVSVFLILIAVSSPAGVPVMPLFSESGTVLDVASAYRPFSIQGIAVFPEDPFKFRFFMTPGDAAFSEAALNQEAERLIRYFLTALTLPEDDIWVNLSPFEKNRITSEELGRTEMGQVLLSQDYRLKQMTSFLMSPDNELGKRFWDKVYKTAYEKYGTSQMPFDVFNKVWIVPQKAVVYARNGRAYIMEARLKVLLDQDYTATRNSDQTRAGIAEAQRDLISDMVSETIRNMIIPELERAVNEGEDFAELRQIYKSLIMAAWFKRHFMKSPFARLYINKRRISGIEGADIEMSRKIFEQYVDLFQKGTFSYIREEYDAEKREVIPREYFSGGIRGKVVLEEETPDFSRLKEPGDMIVIDAVVTANSDPDPAMMVSNSPQPKTAVTDLPSPENLTIMKDLNRLALRDALLLADSKFTDSSAFFGHFVRVYFELSGHNIKPHYNRLSSLEQDAAGDLETHYQMVGFYAGEINFEKGRSAEHLQTDAVLRVKEGIDRLRSLVPQLPIMLYVRGVLPDEVVDTLGRDLYYYNAAADTKTYDVKGFLGSIQSGYIDRQIQKRLSSADAAVFHFMRDHKEKIAGDILKSVMQMRFFYEHDKTFLENITAKIAQSPLMYNYLNAEILTLFAALYPEEIENLQQVAHVMITQKDRFPMFPLEELGIKADRWWAEFCLGKAFVQAFAPYIDFEKFMLQDLIGETGLGYEKHRIKTRPEFGHPDLLIVNPEDFEHSLKLLTQMKRLLGDEAYARLIGQLSFRQILTLHNFSIQESFSLADDYQVHLLPGVAIDTAAAERRFIITFLRRTGVGLGELGETAEVGKYRAALRLLSEAEGINDRLLRRMMDISKSSDPSRQAVDELFVETKSFLDQLARILVNSLGENNEEKIRKTMSPYYQQFHQLVMTANQIYTSGSGWNAFISRMMVYDKSDLRIHSLIHHVHVEIFKYTLMSWTGLNSSTAKTNYEMDIHLVTSEGNMFPYQKAGMVFPDQDAHSPDAPARINNSYRFSYLDLSSEGRGKGTIEFARNVFSRLLGMRFIPSDRYKAVIMDNQFCFYLGVEGGVHSPLLYVHLGNPSQRARVSVRWQDSVDDGGDLRNKLIREILENLGFETQSSELMTVGVFDANGEGKTRESIEKAALRVSSVFTVFSNVDLFLSLLRKQEGDLPGIAADILDAGSFSVFDLIKKGRPVPDFSAVRNLTSGLNRTLSELDLPLIDAGPYEKGDKYFGQTAVDLHFNWPIQRLMDRGIVRVGGDGRVMRRPQFREPQQAFAVTAGSAFAPAVAFDRKKSPRFFQGKIVIADRLTLDDISLIEDASGLVTRRGNKTGHMAINIAELKIPWIVTSEAFSFQDGDLCLVDGNEASVRFGAQTRVSAQDSLDNGYMDEVLNNVYHLGSIEELYALFQDMEKKRAHIKMMTTEEVLKIQKSYARIMVRIRDLQQQVLDEAVGMLEKFVEKNGSLNHLSVGDVDALIRIRKKIARAFGANRPPVYVRLKALVEKHKALLGEFYTEHSLIEFGDGGKIASQVVGNKASKFVETQNMLQKSPFASSLYFTKGFLISSAAFDRFIESVGGGIETRVSGWGDILREHIMEAPIPDDMLGMIIKKHDQLLRGSRVSIRSSSLHEDRADYSFAGMAVSFLNVHADSIPDAVKRVWASLFTQRAIQYMRRHGLNSSELRQGQIVQEMVDADVSGVLRTVDPQAVHKNIMVAETVYGLGPGVVEEDVGSDRIEIHKEDYSFTMVIGEKWEMFVSDTDSAAGIKKQPVDYQKVVQPSLSERQIGLLAGVARHIENYYGYPLDIEFCFKGNKLTILQVRPLSMLFIGGGADYAVKLYDRMQQIFYGLPQAGDLDRFIQDERARVLLPAEGKEGAAIRSDYGGIDLGLEDIDFERDGQSDIFDMPGYIPEFDTSGLMGFSPVILDVDYRGSLMQLWGNN